MKRIALLGAATAGLMIAVPANAQYSHGYSHGHDYGHHDSGHHDYGRHDYGHSYHGYSGYGGYGSDYGYGYGYGYPGYYPAPRVECRTERGYYGPVRRCFTVYR